MQFGGGSSKIILAGMLNAILKRLRDRYVEDADLAGLKGITSEFLHHYIDFKYLTGMRKGDILKLRLDAITDEGIAVTQSKTGGNCFISGDLSSRAVVG